VSKIEGVAPKTWERRQKLHDQQVQAVRAKVGKNAAAQSKAQSVAPDFAMTSAQVGSIASIGGLSDAIASFTASRADLQSKAAQGVFDMQQLLEDQIASAAETIHDNHGDPAAREDDLSQRVRPLLGDKRPEARVDVWLTTLAGRRPAQWRTSWTHDQHGAELDILLQKRRDKAAAKRFFKRVLASCPEAPRKIVTDQLRSYPAAKAEIPELANVKHLLPPLRLLALS
jgi:hypothetical protein